MNEKWGTSAPTASLFVEQSLGSHSCGVELRGWRGGGCELELGVGTLLVVAVVLVVVGYTAEQQWRGEGVGQAAP